jgi:hypothetical protein
MYLVGDVESSRFLKSIQLANDNSVVPVLIHWLAVLQVAMFLGSSPLAAVSLILSNDV